MAGPVQNEKAAERLPHAKASQFSTSQYSRNWEKGKNNLKSEGFDSESWRDRPKEAFSCGRRGRPERG
jgi:hypothetical protein